MAYKCQKCGKTYAHRQSLRNHKKSCDKESKSDTFKKISVMFGMMEPPTKKIKESVKNGVSEVNPPISIAQLRSNAQTSSKSLQTNKELLEKLILFVHELDGNDSLKQEMLAILKQLSKATRSNIDFDKEKSDDDTNEDDSKDETDDENDIYDLIHETAKNLTKNLRENLHQLLFDMNFGYFDEKIRKMIKDFLDGKKDAESVTEILRDDLDSMKVKLIINEIERVQKKVEEVLYNLNNIHDSDVIKTLESLRMRGQITNEQFKRLAIADNDLSSFAKAMMGSGLWLGRL